MSFRVGVPTSALLRAQSPASMRRWPVDRRVNSVKVDEPGLTTAAGLPSRGRRPRLFGVA
jgi:hypothetical protein